MEINHANQSLVPSSSPKENHKIISPPNIGTLVHSVLSHSSPATIVNISDEGYSQSLKENLKGEAIVFDEKSDEAYRAMSFKELVDERDGKGKYREAGDTTIYAMNTYGKAAKEAFSRIRAQQMENTRNSERLKIALEKFRAKATVSNPEINPADIDVRLQNDNFIVLGSQLTAGQLDKLQCLLNGESDEAGALKVALDRFNEGGLNMINMMIYDEKNHYNGKNSEGKGIVHRDEPVTMTEFLNGASYSQIASSGGHFTWNRFFELVGSSKWGNGLVFDR